MYSMDKEIKVKMTKRILRQIPRVNYYEPEEPSFDEYIFCEHCADYVFEYCAIHGPLLVIPDDKVSSKPKFPSFVPRAALTIPHVFLHLARSIIPGAGLGVFSTVTLPRGVRFGPYVGQLTESVDSMYCWQIYDSNKKRSHVVDAVDPNRSNWMRYVNCSRHWSEQNLVAYQFKGQMYYRTIKIIPRFTELLVFYGGEFSNILHINLSKYNMVPFYQPVIEPIKPKITLRISTSDSKIVEIGNNEIVAEKTIDSEELLNFNDFQIIDTKSTTQTDDSLHKNVVFNHTPSNLPAKNENDQRFVCEQCEKTFLKKKYLKKHLLIHLNRQTFQCSECSYSTPYNYCLKRHSLSHNKNVCSNKIDKVRNSLQENLFFNQQPSHLTATNENDQIFVCEQCDKTFLKKSYLKRHILIHSNNQEFQCSECSYSTPINHYLKRHALSHNKNVCSNKIDKDIKITKKSYYRDLKHCEICPFNTLSKGSFRTHMSKHKGNVYQCLFCEYNTHDKQNLKRHNNSKHTIYVPK